MADYTPGEPDEWTWPDAYDGDDEPPGSHEVVEFCSACRGRGWVGVSGVIELECAECGGTGEES